MVLQTLGILLCKIIKQFQLMFVISWLGDSTWLMIKFVLFGRHQLKKHHNGLLNDSSKYVTKYTKP